MALLNFKYGAQSGLSSHDYVQGTVYITTDTKKMFVDLPGETGSHLCLGDFQLVQYDDTTNVLDALAALSLQETNVLYLTVGPNNKTALYRYNGTSFVAISNTEEIADIVSRIDSLETAINIAQDTANAAVKRIGDTMIGLLTLSGAPIDNLHAATKKYVDDAKSSAISTVQGTSADTAIAVTVYGAKKYTEEQVAIIKTALNDLENSIGNLSNIMNFLGVTTTALNDGDSTNPITINNKTITVTAGDVVVVSNSIVGDSTVGDFILSEGKEFVFDGSIWHEIGDTVAQATAISNLQDQVNEVENNVSSLTSKMTAAETDIDNLQAWKESHNTAYTNLESRVGAAETNITNLQNTVGTRPNSPAMDTTLWEEVADLRSDLGESGDAATKTTTAFGRIKALEEWKSTHTTAFNNLSTTVSGNSTAINNLTTVLTWGTF